MRTGNLSKVLAIVALVVLVMVQPVGGNGDDQYDTPEKPELKYLNLGYHLDRMVVRVESGEDSAEEAAEGRFDKPRRGGGGDHIPFRQRDRRGYLPWRTKAATPATWARTTSKPTCQ